MFRKLKFIFLILMLILFTSCGEQQLRYVRNIKIDFVDEKYNVIFEFYDFSSQEENFQTKEYNDTDLEKMCIKAINDNNFNFRLLENVCITPRLFANDINQIFYVLNSIKIPITTDILCLIGDDFPIDKSGIAPTRLYNFSSDKGKVDGLISICGEHNGGLIVSDGQIVKYLDENQWKILNLLIGNQHKFSLKFRDGHMSAKLEYCNVYFHGDDELNIEITVKVKDYNGISDTILYKEMLFKFLESELEDIVYQLYNDVIVSTECKLTWYKQYKNLNSDKINVNVTVL